MGVNKERVELWVRALESEEYVQCFGTLRGDGSNHRCVLGVAIEVALRNGCELSVHEIVSNIWSASSLPPSVTAWYGLPRHDPPVNLGNHDHDQPINVTGVNDSLQLPFWDIAQAIRTTYLKDDDVHGN